MQRYDDVYRKKEVNMTNKIKDFFDEMATDRNAKIAGNLIVEYEQKVRSQMVVSMIEAKPGELILDAGCGNARDLIQLAKKGCKCIGVDFSADMIEEARKELLKNHIESAEVEVGDLNCLRFDDAMFDKVYASEVLEHIPDCNRAVSEMARVLRPGGRLVVTTPNRHSWYGFDRYIICDKILRIKSHHPYDAWKTFDEISFVLNNNGLEIANCAGICYIPGSLVPYRLPKIMAKPLVRLVSLLEPWLSRTFPKSGYSIAVKAIKKSSNG
jgi:ubiquinone biosynthesis O-methyltransferase